jgi:hypothetical protein
MNLEVRTVAAMIHMYAQERIARCPFGDGKPVCNKCTVHCYNPEMRARVQTVMRYAGPRMFWHHPILAIRHLYRSRKTVL